MKKIYLLCLVFCGFISMSSFAQTYYVSGAGTVAANGAYTDTGIPIGGQSSYTNGAFFIYYHTGPGSWVIDNNTIASNFTELYYHGGHSGIIPIETVTWTNSMGALGLNPVPTISLSPAVPVSPWSVVGGILLISIFAYYRIRKKMQCNINC